MNEEEIRASVRKNYTKVAKGTTQGCCGGGGCCCGGTSIDISELSAKMGYKKDDLENVPAEANMGLGCGNPLAIASLKKGETVLDLGCGGGFDCFLASKQVGDTGRVIGVDMTPDMIELARRNASKNGYKNVEFRLGEIENLPVADASIDVIISNCVINLSPDKEQVFKEAYRVLKEGGRLSVSDIVATKKLPQHIKEDMNLVSGCIGGAEYIEDLEEIIKNAGFKNIKLIPKSNSKEIIKSWNFGEGIEDYVASYIIEAEKITYSETLVPSKSKILNNRGDNSMKKMYIYEPAMCCPTGICGVSVDPELLRISTVINSLKKNGIEVERYNLSDAPQKFIDNKAVNRFLNEKGVDGLPVIIIDDKIVISGRYPTNEEITNLLNLPEGLLGQIKPQKNEETSGTKGCGCSGGGCC